jgi:hypothetical protein
MKEWNHDFNERFKKVWGCGVGWSKWYGGCGILCQRMSEWGYCEEADATKYDSTVPADLLSLVWELRYEMLADRYQTPENRDLFRAFLEEILFTQVISTNGEHFVKCGGNPSGSPCTTEDNTFVGIMIFLLQAIRSGYNLDLVISNARLYQCGDDVLFSCTDVVEKLKFEHRRHLLDELGMCWPEDKVLVSKDPCGLTFLGCTFQKTWWCGLRFWTWRPSRPGKWTSTLLEAEKLIDSSEFLQCVRALAMENIWSEYLQVLLDLEEIVSSDPRSSENLDGVLSRPIDVEATRARAVGFG